MIVAGIFLAGPRAFANDPSSVKARPLIPGDVVPEFRVEDISGNSKWTKGLLGDGHTMLVFLPSEAINQKNLRDYFATVRTFIEQLGYKIVVISTELREVDREAVYDRKNPNLYFDKSRSAFAKMGLADKGVEKSSVISGIFFVSPTGKILSAFTSSDNNIPFSGDELVLAARVSKQFEMPHPISSSRSGPTVAPPIENGSKATTKLNTDSNAAAEDADFALPDESVLNLFSVEDIARTNTLWMQASVGVTAYDARRNTWSPRWSPGLQFGRRYNSFGIFFNLALDQTFDFTQEVKRLDVIHTGLGVERISLYGRVRSSLSAGAAILNSDTDIDSRGKIGWYFDLRPLALRWGTSSNNTIELTPFGLNVSVPVTRGIPLILVGYMTTLSFEWASEFRK